jgi:hypothetical protein
MIDQNHVFKIGKEKISKDVCLFNLVSTLNKLKASVGVLVGANNHLFHEIEKTYFEDCTIFMNEEDKNKYDETKTMF